MHNVTVNSINTRKGYLFLADDKEIKYTWGLKIKTFVKQNLISRKTAIEYIIWLYSRHTVDKSYRCVWRAQVRSVVRLVASPHNICFSHRRTTRSASSNASSSTSRCSECCFSTTARWRSAPDPLQAPALRTRASLRRTATTSTGWSFLCRTRATLTRASSESATEDTANPTSDKEVRVSATSFSIGYSYVFEH